MAPPDSLEPLTNIVNWIVESATTAVPLVLSGVIIVVIGWILSKIVEKIVRKSIQELKINRWERKHEINKALYGLKLSEIVTQSIKWYIVLLFINEAATEVNLPFVASIIQSILLLVPNWFLGGVFMLGALIIGHKISVAVEKSKFLFGKIGARLLYVVIIYFALVLALPKFGFENTEILVDTFKILVAGISLGGALAVGLGFGAALKEPAQRMVKDLLK